MYDVYLFPVLVGAPAIKLRPAVLADRDDEGGAGDLLAELQGFGAVEFLGAVTGEAVGRAAQRADEQGDGGTISAEVGVDVPGVRVAQPAEEDAGLGELDNLVKPPAVAALAHPPSEAEGLEESTGPGEACGQQRAEQPDRADAEDDAGLLLFGDVAGVDDLLVPRAERVAVDGDAEGFERVDLAADEALRGLGVLINEVCDFHGLCFPAAFEGGVTIT
jgi:hypothetical protein